jgi:hypothetical protein
MFMSAMVRIFSWGERWNVLFNELYNTKIGILLRFTHSPVLHQRLVLHATSSVWAVLELTFNNGRATCFRQYVLQCITNFTQHNTTQQSGLPSLAARSHKESESFSTSTVLFTASSKTLTHSCKLLKAILPMETTTKKHERSICKIPRFKCLQKLFRETKIFLLLTGIVFHICTLYTWNLKMAHL